MQTALLLLLAFCATVSSSRVSSQDGPNPLSKVIQLLDGLAAKITKDGEEGDKAYKEYFEWCDETAANTRNEIKTATSQKEKLEAKIAELTSDIEVGTSKIEELASSIAENDGELKEATAVREKEAATFALSDKEMAATVDTLERAINILAREMAKNPAALAQIDATSMTTLVTSLSTILDAASFAGADTQKLIAFVQSQNDDSDSGAPSAAVYKTQSGGIVEVLEDLKDKAEAELASLRKAESTSAHNYEMLKQSLEDQVAVDTKHMDEEKSAKAAAQEGKATAEGDLDVTTKELKAAKEKLETTVAECLQVAADHEATIRSRQEELKVVATAKKILVDTSSGAVEQTYSFLQTSTSMRLRTRSDLANSEVVNLVKKLGHKYHSAALAQLASRLTAVVRFGGKNGDDVFAKVKGLINDMIAKLQKEGEAAATEKAYCDEELGKTESKKDELDTAITDMSTKIDQASAKSAELKEEVNELQKELGELVKEQAEMDRIRQDEHEAYKVAKKDLELGLGGVRKALSVLRDYYANDDGDDDASMLQQPAKPAKFEKAGGAASSIIGILEVCESDFATNLAKEESEEADSASIYEKTTQENKVTAATKEQDSKYKTQEFKGLDKDIAELSSDRETANTELTAVMEYLTKLQERCIAKPETYEERKARREAEINGLKEALSILENETALFQQRKRTGHFRGAMAL